ncbi:DUF6520 family protein [Flavobacterium sp. fv08]|uniref:DUF6520 family protein n=1 Tax=Flavobacterium sp. fv08 TaxID=1761784 RepID=UPI0008C5EECC|nr:DUF6520 family protein [Flavobacterium sp. fv08]SEP06328.1 hypothetical protein SAMN04487978_4357 [Flavobacterium sp. fv08]
MKATFIKALVLPIAAFVLASAGAVATDKSSVSKADDVLITGYIHQTTPTSCDAQQVDCDVSGSAPCMFGSNTVWRKANPSAAQPCALPLYKN